MEFFEYDQVSVILGYLVSSMDNFNSQQHGIRVKFVEALEKEFPDMGLKFSIGKIEYFHSICLGMDCYRRSNQF